MLRLSRHRGLVGVAVAGLAVIVLSLILRAGTAPPDSQPTAARRAPGARDSGAHAQGQGAEILPAEPFAFSQLTVRVDAAPELSAAAAASPANGAPEPSGDTGQLRVLWSVNGEDAGEGLTLSPESFDRGDEVRVRVERAARGQRPQPIAWASTTILNAPPVLRAVEIQAVPGQADHVEAIVDGADPDGDPMELQYSWMSDGAAIEGANSARMSISQLTRGQSLTVRVVASDGLDVSAPSLATWSQENHPPSIGATVAASVTRDEAGQARVACPLQVADPDGDSVTVELVDAIDGLQWDAAAGQLVWLPAPEVRQIAVTVRARDDKGGEVQRTLQLSF